MAEVTHAVCSQQLTLEQGNEIVCTLVDKYEDRFPCQGSGMTVNEDSSGRVSQ